MHIKLTKILKKVKQYRFKSDMLININNVIHTSCINRMTGNITKYTVWCENQLGTKGLPIGHKTQMLSSTDETCQSKYLTNCMLAYWSLP